MGVHCTVNFLRMRVFEYLISIFDYQLIIEYLGFDID